MFSKTSTWLTRLGLVLMIGLPSGVEAQPLCVAGSLASFSAPCTIGNVTFSDWWFSGNPGPDAILRPFAQSNTIGFDIENAMSFSTTEPGTVFCGPTLSPGGSGLCSINPPSTGAQTTYWEASKSLSFGVLLTPDVDGSLFMGGVGFVQGAGARDNLVGTITGGFSTMTTYYNVGGPAVPLTRSVSIQIGPGFQWDLGSSLFMNYNLFNLTGPLLQTGTLSMSLVVENGSSATASVTRTRYWWSGPGLSSEPKSMSTVPEPSTAALAAAGLITLWAAVRRRRSA